MTFKNILILLHCLFLGFMGYSSCLESENDGNKDTTLLAKYRGGRIMYSSLTLNLYTDSTYTMTEWIHTGYSSKETGRYSLNDSLITFYPKKKKTKSRKKVRRSRNMEPRSYMYSVDTILLYDPTDDPIGYGALYKTLYKKDE